MKAVTIPGLLTFTIAILVFFAGAGLNRLIEPLQRWNIPEAVTGGMLAAATTLVAYTMFGTEVSFTLDARDMLLLYFFTGIGLNARIGDLVSGGRPLVILLLVTLIFLVIQNLIAAGSVAALGCRKGLRSFVGSASLIGGHGTTIAWAPIINERFGLSNALEVGIATATLGLVIASLVGGPIAGFLIRRHSLQGPVDRGAGRRTCRLPAPPGPPTTEPCRPSAHAAGSQCRHPDRLRARRAREQTGIKLPLFVVCLLVGIVVTNTVPRMFPRDGMADARPARWR